MKRADYFILTLAIVVMFFYFKDSLYPKKSDSMLLTEYQETLKILMEKDTATANKFMRVMEEINTKQ